MWTALTVLCLDLDPLYASGSSGKRVPGVSLDVGFQIQPRNEIPWLVDMIRGYVFGPALSLFFFLFLFLSRVHVWADIAYIVLLFPLSRPNWSGKYKFIQFDLVNILGGGRV